jgi:hypothetical protein
MWNMKIIIFQDNELKSSIIQRPCDFDLWPGDPNINKGHLLVMTNQYDCEVWRLCDEL